MGVSRSSVSGILSVASRPLGPSGGGFRPCGMRGVGSGAACGRMISVLRLRGLFIAPNRGQALSRDRVPSSPYRLAPEVALTLTGRGFGARGGMEAETTTYTFGPYKIDRSYVFYSTPLSFAMVNLRPVLPGHVLVCSRREVKRFVDLSADETCDIWLTAKEVCGRLERYHEASSLTFTIQDGPQAGQTVPHVHIHILPRKSGDFENNDEIYDAINEKEKELKEKLDLDKERKDGTSEEMAREADIYHALFS